MFRLTIATATACLAMGCAVEAEEPAAGSEPVLELTGRVVDAANILSAPIESELTAKLKALEADTGVQLVVATTPSLEGQDIADYSLKLAKTWGIGSAERNDGLVFLVAPNERKVRIEVGYGLEASVRDEEAGQILREAVLPEFGKGDFATGITNGVDRLVAEVTPYKMDKAA